jgi:hypothetical protein
VNRVASGIRCTSSCQRSICEWASPQSRSAVAWQTVSKPVPDARRAGPGIAWKERRTAPRHVAVWVRMSGQWRWGRIIERVRQIDREDWDCVIMADEPVSGPPWQGRYAFDPRSIRP